MQISFIASLPDIQSAILISGDGSTRLKLDIPESELAEAIKMVMLKGTAFRVTIENEILKKTGHKKDDESQFPCEPRKGQDQKGRGKKPKRQTT